MKVRLVNIQRISGIAKATGEAFGPLYRLNVLSPIEHVDSPKFKKAGSGYEVTELEVDEATFKKFMPLQIPEGGLSLELTTENRPSRRGNGFEVSVTGFVQAVAKAA
jgi:hypothetical protein